MSNPIIDKLNQQNEKDGKPSVHEVMFEQQAGESILPKTKSKKWEDNYKRATLYIQNDTLAELNKRSGVEKGVKTAIVNTALQEFFQKILPFEYANKQIKVR